MPPSPPGTLLKRRTYGATHLTTSPESRRLTDHLHDLIIIAYEASTTLRSDSLTLTKLEYASGGRSEGKSYMHLSVLVKDLGHAATIPLKLTITVEPEAELCSELY